MNKIQNFKKKHCNLYVSKYVEINSNKFAKTNSVPQFNIGTRYK